MHRPSKDAALELRPMSSTTLLDSDTMSTIDIEGKRESSVAEEWKPSKKELLIMISLSFVSLMVALDATILVTVLPVSLGFKHHCIRISHFVRRKSHISSMVLLQRLSGQEPRIS